MTSLADVYEDNIGEVGSVRRLYAGTALFLAGVVLTVIAVVVAGTDLLGAVGVSVLEARTYAGVLGGLGVPAVLLGVFTVLPASNRIRGAAAIGASVCVLGVALFWHAYPTYWVTSSAETDLTLVVATVYVFGAFTSIWTLFTAIVNFKTRNDPGGTVELRITQEGETRIVEVDRETAEAVQESGSVPAAALGSGIGKLGRQPDGDVQTQTATQRSDDGMARSSRSSSSRGSGRPSSSRGSSGSSSSRSSSSRGSSGSTSGTQRATGNDRSGSQRSTSASTGTQQPTVSSSSSTGSMGRSSSSQGTAASDGGSTTQDISSPADDYDVGDGRDAEVLEPEPSEPDVRSMADRYCGNCEHFDYVQTNQGMQPYCGYHDEQMEDMEACDAWAPNN